MVRNQKEEVPFEHYRGQFAQLDPKEAAQRLAVPFAADSGCPDNDPGLLSEASGQSGYFAIHFFDRDYRIFWPDYRVERNGSVAAGDRTDEELNTRKFSDYLTGSVSAQILILRWLISGKKAADSSAGYRTFREMPWGEVYIAPYTARCLKRAAFTFGPKLAAFSEACESLGGVRVPHGDAGYEIEMLPGYRMRIFLYEGDEEFAPSAQILYSDSFEEGFSAEDRVVAGEALIGTIKARMTNPAGENA